MLVQCYRFYAASWKNPQSPANDKHYLYISKLKQLSSYLPPRFTKTIENTQKNIGQIIDLVPWGWSYFGSDPSRSRALFWKTFLREIEYTISDECRHAINEVRTLKVLLQYNFRSENRMVNPVKDTTYLDAFLKDELTLAEERASSNQTLYSQLALHERESSMATSLCLPKRSG